MIPSFMVIFIPCIKNVSVSLQSIQNKQNNVQKHRNTGSTEHRGPQCQGFDAAQKLVQMKHSE